MSSQLALSRDPIERIRQARHGINRVAFSPTGRYVATSDVRMNVSVRQADETLFRRNYESENPKVRPMDRVRGLSFSNDGSLLYIAAGDTLRAVEWMSGRESWAYTPPRSFGFLIISPTSFATSVAGDVAAAFDNGSIAIWDSSGKLNAKWHDNDAPRSMFFTKDGRTLVGTDSFSLCAWNVDTQKKVVRKRLKDRAFGLAVSSAGMVATRSLTTATVWDLEAETPVLTTPVGSGLPLVEFSPVERVLALGSEHAIELIDFVEGPIARFEISDAKVLSLAFSPEGTDLAVGCSDDRVKMIPLPR
jgi:WD40 repeat protein